MENLFVKNMHIKVKELVGNFLILGENIESVWVLLRLAVSKINQLKNVILPFPGGIVRSGSRGRIKI